MTKSYSSEVFGSYLSTSYGHRSDLSPEGLARVQGMYRREFADYLPADKTVPILEIGCAHGGFLDFLVNRGYSRVTGLDISPELVELCKERGHPGVVCADGVDFLSTNDDEYGLIVLIDVLEHLSKTDAIALLKVIYRRLQPGGRLILRVPNMSNPLNLQARYGDFTHETGYSKESLEQVLRIADFEVETVHGAAGRHSNPLARIVFDRFLWWAFRQFCRRTLQLRAAVLRGKNLIGVARKASPAIP